MKNNIIMPLNILTFRQQEIVDRILKGWSNKQIAIDLNIQTHTVSVHLQNIYPKLGVHSRYEVFAKFGNSEK
jgi:DNA-binding NarL/FixJ family response regulator